MNGSGWGMGFGGPGMMLFWIILIVAVVMLGRWLGSDSAGRDNRRGKTALEILEERYARGEIGRDEFEQKKRDLQQ
jgi:putative membrane protein